MSSCGGALRTCRPHHTDDTHNRTRHRTRWESPSSCSKRLREPYGSMSPKSEHLSIVRAHQRRATGTGVSRQGRSIRGHELFGRTNAVCSFRCLDRLRGAAASDVQGLDVGGFAIRVARRRFSCSRPSRARWLRRAQGCLRTSRVPTMLQVLLSIARRSQGAYQPIGPK
jgi:hypothetical protein